MTRLIFVRHGQSESNLARIFTGQGNVPLTPLGMEQAERTAEYLKDQPITHIYASDLLRAMQTAAPTARMHGLTVTPNERLREVMAGDWEGRYYADLMQEYPESYGVWLNDIGNAQPDGGEAVVDLAERIKAEVARLVSAHRGECIAIFSHATPMRAMACTWMGFLPQEMAKTPWAPNASVSIADYDDDGKVTLLQYGYDEHQGDSSTAIPRGMA